MEREKLEHFVERGYFDDRHFSLLNDIKNLRPPRFEKDHGIPMLVLGGLHDDIVNFDHVKEVAEYFGLNPYEDDEYVQFNQNCAHSTVLDREGLWSADVILEFLNAHGK
eukprot:c6235_g1_i3.p2 GENE.c6235_g1_i3~~c6235_g1_i3.p2  ORF type:complete len:109 (+),score=29.21 c6235_g1_i3:669-995(+)